MVGKISASRRIFIVFNSILLGLASLACLVPVIHVLMASFSHPVNAAKHTGLFLWPDGFSLLGYERVFTSPEIWRGYLNTIFYVVCSVSLGSVLTMLGAYVLSRRNLLWNKFFTLMITFTMVFNGGLIPTYIVISKLGWVNTPLAVIIPGCMTAFNLIIMRTFFAQIPVSLEESAKLDGASNMRILISIMIPLSKASIAVIALFYSVAQWNGFFQPMIYLQKRELYPLQLVLRDILITYSSTTSIDASAGSLNTLLEEVLKYGVIIVSIVPMLILYPFIQRYFVTGVMIGSIKG